MLLQLRDSLLLQLLCEVFFMKNSIIFNYLWLANLFWSLSFFTIYLLGKKIELSCLLGLVQSETVHEIAHSNAYFPLNLISFHKMARTHYLCIKKLQLKNYIVENSTESSNTLVMCAVCFYFCKKKPSFSRILCARKDNKSFSIFSIISSYFFFNIKYYFLNPQSSHIAYIVFELFKLNKFEIFSIECRANCKNMI